jgi:RNA polymerase sigma-70 factor (ECF subfamily)
MEANQALASPRGEITDADLLPRVALGDRAAFVSLVERWEDPLLQIAHRIVGRHDEAEEIRQIVLLRILEAPQRLPDPSHFAAWIRRCVVNEAVTRARRRDLQRRTSEGFAAASEARQALCAADNAANAEESQRLLLVMQKVDSETRALLSLRFDENLTFQEIADVLERPVSTIKSSFARAIEQLRNLLVHSAHHEE